MSAVTTGVFVTAVAALAGVAANVVMGWWQKPKIAADTQGVQIATESVAIKNAGDVIAIVNEAVDKAVAREHAECQASITALRKEISRLERALIDHNIPIPRGEL